MGEPRVNWVKEQYDTYRKRRKWGYATASVSLVDLLFLFFVQPLFPKENQLLVGQIAAIILLGLFVFTAYLIDRDFEYYLPEIEDRLLCFLKPAADSLRAYESYWKEKDKKKALKKLRDASHVLDEWDVGNLKFIKNGPVGKMLSAIQSNFRGGLLPALEIADKAKMRDILVVVVNMEKVLEQTNTIGDENLDIWNQMLSRYPSVEPPKPLWRKIPAKKSQIPIGLIVFAVPVAIGTISVILFHVSVDTAFVGTITLFGIIVGVLVLPTVRKKTN